MNDTPTEESNIGNVEFSGKQKAEDLLRAVDETRLDALTQKWNEQHESKGLAEIGVELARSGDVDQALEVMKAAPIPDRALVNASAGVYYAESGNSESATDFLSRSRQLLDEVTPTGTPERGQSYVVHRARIAFLHAEAGATDEAMEIINAMPEVRDKAITLADIGERRATTDPGQAETFFSAALANVMPEKDAATRDTLLEYLVGTEVAAGHYAGALEAAHGIKDDFKRHKLTEQLESAEPPRHINTDEALPDWERELLGPEVSAEKEVVELAQSGRIETAMQTATSLQPAIQAEAIARIAAEAARFGYDERARELENLARQQMGQLEDPTDKWRVLVGLVRSSARLGDLDAATQQFDKLRERTVGGTDRVEFLGSGRELIESLIMHGDLDRAETVLDQINWSILSSHVATVTGSHLRDETATFDPTARMIEEHAAAGSMDQVLRFAGPEGAVSSRGHRDKIDMALMKGLVRKDAAPRLQAREQLRQAEGEAIEEAGPSSRLNLVPLLELAEGRPDRVLALSRLVGSSEQFVGILKGLDRSSEMTDEERSKTAAALLASVKSLGLTKEWRQELFDADLPQTEARNRRDSLERLERLIGTDVDEMLMSKLLSRGYHLDEVARHPWLATREIAELEDEAFPASRGAAEQDRWLANHSFARLEGFNQRSVGALIRTRLETGQATTLHDASLWLETFKIYTTSEAYQASAVDIRALKQALAEGKEVNPDDFKVPLHDESLEFDLLRAVAAGNGDLSRLPSKPERYRDLFMSPAREAIYQALLERPDLSQPFSMQELRDRAMAHLDGITTYRQERAKEMSEPISQEMGFREIELALADIHEPPEENISANAMVGRLRAMATARKNYVDDATSWLESHRNSPSSRLQRAWGDRPLALANGIPDQALAIEQWSKLNAVHIYAHNNADSNGVITLSGFNFGSNEDVSISIDELRTNYGRYTEALSQRYSAQETIEAAAWLKQNLNTEADFPAGRIELAEGYTFEVIPKDDPRGFTLGYDTACCMTIGGAAQSCIEAGYSDRRYGFGAVYEPDGTLLAQAVLYHNPDQARATMVLDNIEHNEGRDKGRIIEHFRNGLTSYVDSQQLPFRQVNLGLGYLELSVEGFPRVDRPISTPKSDVYTDADAQVRILELTRPGELASRKPELFEPADMTSIAKLVEMERAIYPAPMREGADSFAEELEGIREEDNFSFMIHSESDREPLGYVIATRNTYNPTGLYVADLAVLPERQNEGWGMRAMQELFGRLEGTDIQEVSFEARASTTYRALQSPGIRTRLRSLGYEVAEEEHESGYYSGEDGYSIRLRRIDNG